MLGPNSLQPLDLEREQPRSREAELHHTSIELQRGVLFGRDEAVQKWGINGDIVAVIKLPGTPTEGHKDLAVVDYGYTEEGDAPYAFAKEDGPFTFLGKTPSRYALVGLTHRPHDQIVAFLPLTTGETAIGRTNDHKNYLLGIAPDEENVEQISRQHLSVRLTDEGGITISDHSTNGTKVEVPNVEEDAFDQRLHVAWPLGLIALGESEDIDDLAPKKLNILEAAKAVFTSATGNDWLLGNVPGLDTLLDLMKPEERQAFQTWQLEQAAVRTPSLWEVVEKSTKDDAGTHVVPEQLTEDFEKALEAYGVRREPPSETTIEDGIAQAKKLVDSDRAGSVLENEEFMEQYELNSLMRNAKKVMVNFQDTMYIDPSLIRGAGGFDSWAGRGHNGWEDKSYTKANGQHVTGASIDAITDYATRPTQLPKLEYLALNLILTKEGPVFYLSHGSHRTAAARLRNEPLRFSSIEIIDAR